MVLISEITSMGIIFSNYIVTIIYFYNLFALGNIIRMKVKIKNRKMPTNNPI